MPSSAYFDHHDAVWQTTSWRSAQTSTEALICRLLQEGANYAVKIRNGDSRKVVAEFFSTSNTFVASCHHRLATYSCSSPHLGPSGGALDMSLMRP